MMALFGGFIAALLFLSRAFYKVVGRDFPAQLMQKLMMSQYQTRTRPGLKSLQPLPKYDKPLQLPDPDSLEKDSFDSN